MSNPHFAATKGWLEYSADENPDVDGRAMHAAALAQAEATLALAYEQRTANLIALHRTAIHALTNGFELEDKATTELEDLAHQIETRLGLGDTK